MATPQIAEINMAAVKAKNHRKTGHSAFSRFCLKDDRETAAEAELQLVRDSQRDPPAATRAALRLR